MEKSERMLRGQMRQANCKSRLKAEAVSGLTLAPFSCATAVLLAVTGCSMQEEVKRIEQVKHDAERRAAASSTDLTGKQIYIRSCNTCHPGGRQGLGPALDQISQHFKTDQQLRNFIRKGKGAMPAQPREAINDHELDGLVAYLRSLNQ